MSLTNIEQHVSYLWLSRAIFGYICLFLVIPNFIQQSPIISAILGYLGGISGYLGVSQAILNYLKLSRAIWAISIKQEQERARYSYFETFLVLFFFATGSIEELALLKMGIGSRG